MLEFFRFEFFGKRPEKGWTRPSVEVHSSKNREHVWYLSAAFTQNRINKGTMLFQHSSKTSSQKKVVSNFLLVRPYNMFRGEVSIDYAKVSFNQTTNVLLCKIDQK